MQRPARAGLPPYPPTPDGGAPEARLFGGFAHTHADSAEQNDPRPRHEALRRIVLAHDGLKTVGGVVGQVNGGSDTAGHIKDVETSDGAYRHQVIAHTSQTISGFPSAALGEKACGTPTSPA